MFICSRRCVLILREYKKRFPEVFKYFGKTENASKDMFHELDMFPGQDGVERVRELLVWLDNLPTRTAQRQPFGTQTLDDEVIGKIEATMDRIKGAKRKEIIMQVGGMACLERLHKYTKYPSVTMIFSQQCLHVHNLNLQSVTKKWIPNQCTEGGPLFWDIL